MDNKIREGIGAHDTGEKFIHLDLLSLEKRMMRGNLTLFCNYVIEVEGKRKPDSPWLHIVGNKRQWTQHRAQDIAMGYKDVICFQTLEQISQRGCGTSNPENTKKATGESHEQPALTGPALHRMLALQPTGVPSNLCSSVSHNCLRPGFFQSLQRLRKLTAVSVPPLLFSPPSAFFLQLGWH